MCFQDFFCNRHAHDIKSLLVFVPDTGVRHTVPCVFPKTQQNGGFHSLLHEENTGFLRAQIVFIKWGFVTKRKTFYYCTAFQHNLPEIFCRLSGFFDRPLRWSQPVSYTHLDVYKRQPICWSKDRNHILTFPLLLLCFRYCSVFKVQARFTRLYAISSKCLYN